jgi:hypothetical protein
MESPETQEEENEWLERGDIDNLMNEIKIKYMKKEFEGLKVTKFDREQTDMDDPNEVEKKRSIELIYLDQIVYLVIKEAAMEISTEEIYYNLILVKYDPKMNEVKELFKRQLNKNSLKSVGYTCERICFIRY